MSKGRIAGVVAAVATLLCCGSAFAQRGGDYVEQDGSPVRSTNSGFPGLFDTELAKKGAVTGSLPWLNAHVGVTENLTVGTNALYVLPNFALQPAGLLLTRYRVNSSPNMETTMDIMVGGLRINSDRWDLRSTIGIFGTNTLFVLHPKHHLILNMLAGTFGFGYTDNESTAYTNASVYGAMFGATYRVCIASWVSFQGTVLPLSYLTGEMDSSTGLLEANLVRPSAYENILYRAIFAFRARSWLFELGALGAGKLPVPWFNIGFEIGG